MRLLTNTLLCSSLLTLVAVTTYTDDAQSISQYSKADSSHPTVEALLQNGSPKHRGSGRCELAQYDV
ncbi:hypothetical protein JOY44_15345 [Phormidium sp. CLA17]|uniref:hypothetical protein n=1 Tax=Leptolyngbya sp. Cla-17 TaxID=2803751 RepID=UPI001933114D|nr:hypothetical protein [Leptolyngbya sp. Cla-17]MBM0742964.1 hypothetical protein [Leptolyngbya sp. Cla-17]